MTYHDFSFFLSFVKNNIFQAIICREKHFLLKVQEEKILWLASANATQYHRFQVCIYKRNLP